MTDKVTPIRAPEVIAEVGGPVDEFRVTLAIYGETLEPEDVSRRLGRLPTHAHRKGDSKKAGRPPYPTGAWLLTLKGKAPSSLSDSIVSLLQELPVDGEFWKSMTSAFDVQLRIGIHTGGWNRGFSISPDAAAMIATTGASMGFDLYFYGEDDHV
jgi:hypothetical protein